MVVFISLFLGFFVGFNGNALMLHFIVLLNLADGNGILAQFLLDDGPAPACQFCHVSTVEATQDGLHVGHDALDFIVLLPPKLFGISED